MVLFTGAINYSPMEGYGYGHADPSQSLPTAQEVVQSSSPADAKPSKEDYHTVPPSWELNIQIGSYGQVYTGISFRKI